MEFHRDSLGDGNIIRRFGADGIQVNETLVSRSCIVSRDVLLPDWGIAELGDLTAASLDMALDLEPELILLGSGKSLHFPPARITAYVNSRNIGFEVMDTAAACRTYNVLTQEGRNIVAALIID